MSAGASRLLVANGSAAPGAVHARSLVRASRVAKETPVTVIAGLADVVRTWLANSWFGVGTATADSEDASNRHQKGHEQVHWAVQLGRSIRGMHCTCQAEAKILDLLGVVVL